MIPGRLLLTGLLGAVLLGSLSGQTLQQLRDQLRNNLQHHSIVSAESAMVQVMVTPEIATAIFRVDEPDGDVEFSTHRIPFQKDIDMGWSFGSLFVEGSLAYLKARDRANIGLGAGTSTTVMSKFRSYSGMLGLGSTVPIGGGVRVRPSVSFAFSDIENSASYDAVGRQLVQPIADGILFNWDATTSTTIGSFSFLWHGQLESTSLSFHSRYAYAYTEGLDGSDKVQEGHGETQLLVSELRWAGDSSLTISGAPLGWELFGGNTSFLDVNRDALGFKRFYSLGGAILADTRELDAYFSGYKLSGAILLGEDLLGWTVGFSVSF